MERAIRLKKDIPDTNYLKNVEQVAKQQLKHKRIENIVSISFTVFLFVVLTVGYFLLFEWYVDREMNILNSSSFIDMHPWLKSYIHYMILVYLIFGFFSARKGLYIFDANSSLSEDFLKLLRVVVLSFLVSVGVLFMMKTSVTYSRVFVIGYAFFMFVISFAVRVLGVSTMRLLRARNHFSKNILIIGAGKVGTDVGRYFEEKNNRGYKLIGYLDDQKEGSKILGKLSVLERVVQKHQINEIYITIPSERKTIHRLLTTIKKYNISIKIIPELYDISTTGLKFHSSEIYPYVELVKTPLRGFNLFIKRLADVILSSIGLLVLLPFFVIIGVLIKIDSNGPVFFKQRRIGKNGVPFTMYKFRSMVVNAEQVKKNLMKNNDMDGPVFKMKDDPRITKFGRFIRKYSIDELPQIINVLIGNMSLIGPRPPLPEEVAQYNDYQWQRLDVKPGISGLWQISGRNDVSFEEWVGLDIYYIENWSLMLDMKILFQTIPVVIKGKGAY